jgi:hypothetical protein
MGDPMAAGVPFTKSQSFPASVGEFLGGEGLMMTRFGLIAAGAVAAASLWIGGVTANAAGALAIGNCGAYGFAYDYKQEAAAAQAALGKCAGGCKVVQVKRACGAIAIDGHNACKAHGYAVAPRLALAQNSALQQCYQYGGKDCVIRAWACDAKG